MYHLLFYFQPKESFIDSYVKIYSFQMFKLLNKKCKMDLSLHIALLFVHYEYVRALCMYYHHWHDHFYRHPDFYLCLNLFSVITVHSSTDTHQRSTQRSKFDSLTCLYVEFFCTQIRYSFVLNVLWCYFSVSKVCIKRHFISHPIIANSIYFKLFYWLKNYVMFLSVLMQLIMKVDENR